MKIWNISQKWVILIAFWYLWDVLLNFNRESLSFFLEMTINHVKIKLKRKLDFQKSKSIFFTHKNFLTSKGSIRYAYSVIKRTEMSTRSELPSTMCERYGYLLHRGILQRRLLIYCEEAILKKYPTRNMPLCLDEICTVIVFFFAHFSDGV